jgi:MATE family multidrug resistance protein
MSSEAESRAASSGSLREVARVAWPIVVGMLSFTAMGLADTLFVGGLGTAAVAGVGLGAMAFYLLNGFFIGTIHGVKVVSAQATGAGDDARALRAAWAGIVLALPLGLAVLGVSVFGEEIFAWMGGSEETRAWANAYFRARVWGAAPAYVAVAICDLYQGRGDTRTPMAINLFANVSNIALDALLVFGLGPIPAMGVAGAGWATSLSWLLAMVLSLAVLWRREGLAPRLSWVTTREVARLGLPIGVNYWMGVSGFALFTSMIARMGDEALAAHQIVMRIVSVSFLPGHGIGEAACVLVGQAVGAGRLEDARRAFWSAASLGVMVMGGCGVLFFVAPRLLLGAFQAEGAVVELGVQLLTVAALFQLLDAVAMVASGALNGAGQTRFTMMASMVASWLVMLPSGYFFGVTLGWGAVGAWVGMSLELLALSVLLMARFQRWSKAPARGERALEAPALA